MAQYKRTLRTKIIYQVSIVAMHENIYSTFIKCVFWYSFRYSFDSHSKNTEYKPFRLKQNSVDREVMFYCATNRTLKMANYVHTCM